MEYEDTSRLQNPFLLGSRIYLRPLEPAQDNHLYSTWMNDDDTRRYFSIYPTSDTGGKSGWSSYIKTASTLFSAWPCKAIIS